MRCADPGQKVTGRDKRVAFCTVAFLFIYIFICPYTAIAHRTHCWSESVNITLSAAVLRLDRSTHKLPSTLVSTYFNDFNRLHLPITCLLL